MARRANKFSSSRDSYISGIGGSLFDEQQLLRMRKLERNAPLLMKREPELVRPGRMPAEDRQGSLKDGATGGARPLWLAEEEEAH